MQPESGNRVISNLALTSLNSPEAYDQMLGELETILFEAQKSQAFRTYIAETAGHLTGHYEISLLNEKNDDYFYIPEYQRLLVDQNALIELFKSKSGDGGGSGQGELQSRSGNDCDYTLRDDLEDDEYITLVSWDYENRQNLRREWCGAMFSPSCQLKIAASSFQIEEQNGQVSTTPRTVEKLLTFEKRDLRFSRDIEKNVALDMFRGSWLCREGLSAESMLYTAIGINHRGSGDRSEISTTFNSTITVEDPNSGAPVEQQVSTEITVSIGEDDVELGSWHTKYCDYIATIPTPFDRQFGKGYSGSDVYRPFIREGGAL